MSIRASEYRQAYNLRGKQEDADESNITCGRDRVSSLWRSNAYIETDVEHGKSLSDGADEKRASSTQRIGHEEEETDARSNLDDTVDTGAEERSRCTSDTQVLEDSRCVRVDGVCTRHLLADHERDRDDGTSTVAGDSPHLLL